MRGKPSVFWLLPSVCLSTVAFTLLQPIMPGLKASWFTGICPVEIDPNCQLKRAQEISGILSSVRSLIVFSVSAYLGRVSDRVGRVPMLRLNNIGSMLPILALYFTNGESALAYYFTFVLSGFVSVGPFQAVAYVADCSPVELRARYFGYLGAIQGLALVTTPLVTAFLSGLSNNDLFIISGLMLAINGLWIEFVLPESLGVLQEPDHINQQGSFWKAAVRLVRYNDTVFWLALCIFFTALPEQGVVEIVLMYLVDVLGLDTAEGRKFSALFLSFTGIGVFVSQTLLMWIFITKLHLGPIWLMFISTVANIVHLLVYASLSLNHSEMVAYANIGITTFMFVGLPAGNAMLSKKTHPAEQGLAMGTLDSIRSLVGSFGPVLFSFLYSFFGERNGFPQAPFLVGAAFASLGLLVILGPLRNSEKTVSNLDDREALIVENNNPRNNASQLNAPLIEPV
jgi:DHA1 family tetracycline resistance protein-like MFS transporter